MSTSEKKQLKRRSSIEATIGHMKSEGLLAKSYLKGVKGNEINAILCSLGDNIRLILKKLRFFLLYIFYLYFYEKNQKIVKSKTKQKTHNFYFFRVDYLTKNTGVIS